VEGGGNKQRINIERRLWGKKRKHFLRGRDPEGGVRGGGSVKPIASTRGTRKTLKKREDEWSVWEKSVGTQINEKKGDLVLIAQTLEEREYGQAFIG